jgi:virulence factor Mce-like protein
MNAPARRLVAGLLAAAAVVAVVVLTSSGDGGHRITVLADEARFMRPGLEVRVAGQPVGTVERAEPTRAGRARLELRIDDGKVWPLPVGTKAQLRWAGAIAFTNRYVELLPPARRGGASIPEGGTIAGRDVVPTVEIDSVTQLFDAPTRRALGRTLTAGGKALGPIAPSLRRALDTAPSAVGQASELLTVLDRNRDDLGSLLHSTDGVVHAIDRSNPGIGALTESAGTTLAAVRARSADLKRAFTAAPATMDVARAGLRQADRTLRSADGTLTALAPGVRQLRMIAAPLRQVLRSVVTVAPDARGTLATLRRATVDVNPLVDQATALMPRLQSVGAQAATQLTCLRPYAPELAGLASTWTGFISHGDGRDKYARVTGAVYPHPTSLSIADPEQWIKLFPGLKFVFPRPPGQVVGQPWFDERCGVGRDSLDASKDPEKIG